MDDLLAEFLTETNESLERLDAELVRLEQTPNDPGLIGNIFRLVHTIKGTCGFLGLPRLESVAHAGEDVLGRFRDGSLTVTPGAVTLILAALDRIKMLVAALEADAAEPAGDDAALIASLNELAAGRGPAAAEASPAAPSKPAATAESAKKTLLERVGGLSAVDAAVETLYRKVLADPELARFFEGVDMTVLQMRQVQFVAHALGGTDGYDGRDMRTAHAHLVRAGLNAGHFDRVAGYLQSALRELDVDEATVGEVLAVVATTKADILAGSDVQAEPAEPAPTQPAAAPAAAPAHPHAEADGAGGREGGGEAGLTDKTIRVKVELLSNLMTMVSELVLTRNQLMQMVRKYEDSEFKVPLQRLSHVATELQEGVMKTRMQPIGNAWNKLPRIVRDLAHELGKKIELDMRGAETELDRQVLELIKDPLTHMVRNSGDHGLETPEERRRAGKPETGRITLNAYHEGGHILIEISDDGRGIDARKVKAKAVANGMCTESEAEAMSDQRIYQFIFQPGFSTAEKVTSVSGRGVGMDVVRTNIDKIGGHIELKSTLGKGSTFVIKIPLTLAIISALIVECRGERFAIPQISVDELVRVSATTEHRIEKLKNTPVLRLRNRLLPLVALDALLQLGPPGDPPAGTDGDETFIIVARAGNFSFGIIVDRVFDTEEIVVKPVSPLLRDIKLFSGNTILGDGSVIMILDPNGIAGATGESRVAEHEHDSAAASRDAVRDEKIALLVFNAGGPEPKVVPLALVARLEELDVSTIEYCDGTPVVQYRGQLMPLVLIDPRSQIAESGRQAVVVFSDRDRVTGMVVDSIIDVVEEKLEVKLASQRPGLLGVAVVDGRATEIVDANFYLSEAFSRWYGDGQSGSTGSAGRVLLVDDSSFFRNLLTPLLGSAGYEVVTAENGARALDLRESGESFDVIISDIEMPEMDGLAFARAVRERGPWQETPILALSSHATEQDVERGRAAGFAGYVPKLDREALFSMIERSVNERRSAA